MRGISPRSIGGALRFFELGSLDDTGHSKGKVVAKSVPNGPTDQAHGLNVDPNNVLL